MIGPGKYNAECTAARKSTHAVAAILIVIGGEHGSGFSCQTLEPAILSTLPAILETVAAQIRRDAQRAAN